jgi:hypothetical protein
VTALTDTNILVCRYDPRFLEKQGIATELTCSASGSPRIPFAFRCGYTVIEYTS